MAERAKWRVTRRVATRLAVASLIAAAVGPVVGEVVTASVDRVFVVDSIGDSADLVRGDGVCNAASSGQPRQCTLRAAIEEAEASAGHDRIEFGIAGAGPHVIRPGFRLPIMYDPAGVTIDGYTQPGAAVNTSAHGSNADIRIELRGQGSTGIDGLYFSSSNNVVRGLAIFDFQRHVYLRNSDARSRVAEHNAIVGNFIGTNAAGTFIAGRRNPVGSPASSGVHLESGASNNEIGRPTLADRNVISGTAGRGIATFDDGTDGNIIRNNVIGLTPGGGAPLKNWAHGIDINYGSSRNIIGGLGPLEGNVISGNDLSGIEISHNSFPSNDGIGATEGNLVLGNLIGTDASGTRADLAFSNGEFGVGLEGKGRCSDSCTPDIHDNEVRGNVIVGAQANVMIWKGAHRNVVADNSLGVLADGVTASQFPTIWGVLIEAGAFDNVVVDNRIAEVDNGIVVRPDNNYPSGCQAGDTTCPADALFPTYGNRFTGNSIENVGPGLGVDLWPVGRVTVAPDPALVQDGVQLAVIRSVTTDRAVVEACDGCVVEMFETTAVGSDHGQGRRSLGTSVVSGGVAAFEFRTDASDPVVVEAGQFVSALVSTSPSSTASSSTSEFSARRTVGPGDLSTSTAAGTTTTTATTIVPAQVPADGIGVVGPASASAPAVRCSVSAAC